MYKNINLSEDVFTLKPEEYKRKLNPLGHYIQQQAQFISIMENIPFEEAKEFVTNTISKNGKYPVKHRKVEYIRKDENGDRVEDETTFYNYLYSSIKNEEIITGPFVTYLPHKKKLSYIVDFVDEAIPARKKLKKLQFQRKQEGDVVGEAYANNGQNNIKRSINSISGASSITSTPIYSLSMHPVLTSNCRMTSGYANANNEKLLGGNRHYHNADITINNVVALTTNINEELIQSVINKYNLYIPNPDELLEYILTSTRQYWVWPEKEEIIKSFLYKCSNIQRAAIAYIYDLNAMKQFNPKFTMDFITSLAMPCNPIEGISIEEAADIFNKSLETIKLVAIQIYSNDVKGLKENQYINTDTILKIAASIVNIYSVLDKHRDYIEAFLRTNHLPSSLAQLPNCLRKVVLMSDTDSSIFTTKHWTNWCCKEKGESFRKGVFATMVMLSSTTLKHLLATMSANLGVETKRIFTIGMKNEYGMPKLVNLNRTKHYMYTVDYQEGTYLKELDLDKKGVHLRNSNSPPEIIEHAEDIMTRLFYLYKDDNIKLADLLKEVGDVEREIIKNVKEGGIKYYRRGQD